MATALFRDLDEPTFVPNQDILNLVRDDDDLAATPEGPVMIKVVCRRDPRLPENQQPQPLRFKMKHVRATIVRVVQGRIATHASQGCHVALDGRTKRLTRCSRS